MGSVITSLSFCIDVDAHRLDLELCAYHRLDACPLAAAYGVSHFHGKTLDRCS